MLWARRSLLVVRHRCFSSAHHGRYYPEMYGLLRKDKVSVEEAFDVLKQRTNPFDIRGCDSFYFSCLEQSPLPTKFVKDIVQFFQRILDEDERGPNDGAFSSMIGILAHHGEPDLAYSLLRQKYEKNTTVQPYYRSYAPLLEYYIQAKQLDKAWTFWEYIKSINTTQPPDKVGPSLVLFAIATLGEDEALFRKVIRELNELRYQLTSDDVAKWLSETSQIDGWITTQLPEDSSSQNCSHCNQTLKKLTVSSDELNTLLDTVKTMCLESRYIPSDPKAAVPTPMSRKNKLKALKSFEDWLRKRHEMVQPGKLHYILDGPNIAYLNQNFEGGAYRFDHIDKLAKQLQAEGHVASVTMPGYYFDEVSYLSVKTSKRNPYKKAGTRYFRKRTPEDKAFLDSWQEQNLAFRAEREVASDDLYWMYGTFYLMSLNANAGISENIVRVVSNDEIKDHIVSLVETHNISRDLIDRWKGSACVGVSLAFEKSVPSIVLQHPLPFSRVAQEQGHAFHLPTNRSSWLCCFQPLEMTFFGVYLLTPQKPPSGPSKHMRHTYIGFTVSPKRRLRQHNGDIVNGAKKTCKYRPWDMLVVVYGFTSKVQALQFEYVWQHPYNSRFTKPHMKHLKANKAFGGIRSVKRKLLELYSIVNIAPWSELALTISFTTREILDLAKSMALLEAPACMQIQIATLDALPQGKDGEDDEACSICFGSIVSTETPLRCYHSECSMQSHVNCINECFPDEPTNKVRSMGFCPLCDKELEWSRLLAKAQPEQVNEQISSSNAAIQEAQAFDIPIDSSIIDLTNDD